MDYIELNNGIKMPQLGLGMPRALDPVACEGAVRAAIGLGYRLIDTEPSWNNEEPVGRAVATSGVPRDAFFITGTLEPACTCYDDARRAFDTTLERMGLDYLDLYLIHRPYGDIAGAWRALVELYEEGVVRALGVATFRTDQVDRLMAEAELPPAIDQIAINVCLPQMDTVRYLEERGVALETRTPLAEGRDTIARNPVLAGVGARHGKSAAQVALRWLLQRRIICIPRQTDPAQLADNIAVFDFELSDEEMLLINELACGVKRQRKASPVAAAPRRDTRPSRP